MRGHVACMGEMRCTSKMLLGNPEGKTPLEKPGRITVGKLEK